MLMYDKQGQHRFVNSTIMSNLIPVISSLKSSTDSLLTTNMEVLM